MQQTPNDVRYLVIARGDSAASSEDAAVLRNYFNLQACLEELSQQWSSRDARYKSIHTYFPGRPSNFSCGSLGTTHMLSGFTCLVCQQLSWVYSTCWSTPRLTALQHTSHQYVTHQRLLGLSEWNAGSCSEALVTLDITFSVQSPCLNGSIRSNQSIISIRYGISAYSIHCRGQSTEAGSC